MGQTVQLEADVVPVENVIAVGVWLFNGAITVHLLFLDRRENGKQRTCGHRGNGTSQDLCEQQPEMNL